ncbi:MAG TPA: prepilin-type N-terminal cleavage/methylation domain-containing protein [Sedimentisphaerales bacterium]|nr:prepilin-type N-terminal cleavage/methylation domain-containing protein [Sedimentisphaerales bacterium]HRS09633.1 prepilin-type N-terminal cleavage/methylation domain-containing protein [Sedimentisphaerales bacterium]HRV46314.1 prepilin-type N-terminal cleavage/methylation domain-containing protein [Sedimentisphaerales bacterium]
MKANRGFTLVEILIVVVILGILAAIVVPQFTQASTEAKENSLCSNLQSLRSQIELYKVQHNDNAPALATFEQQMTFCTDIDGNIQGAGSKVRDATNGFIYGPYLERVPANPFNDLNTLAAMAASGTPAAVGDNTTGWQYFEDTGEIYPNDDGSTASGTPHASL